MFWNKQKIEPQDLTDLQENTKAITKMINAIWYLFFMLLIMFVYLIMDRLNIVWNVLQ